MKVRVTESFSTNFESQYLPDLPVGAELTSPFADFCVREGHPVEILEGELAAAPVADEAPASIEDAPAAVESPVVDESYDQVPVPAVSEALSEAATASEVEQQAPAAPEAPVEAPVEGAPVAQDAVPAPEAEVAE